MEIVKKQTIVASALLVFIGVTASAEPIIFQLDSVAVVGPLFPYDMAFTPALPVVGSGDIDFGAGTGVVTLPDFTMDVDLNTDGSLDATVSLTGWQETITSIVAGAITSTSAGAVSCIDLGGAFGSLVCDTFSSAVIAWPPPGGTALIDTGLQTITVVNADGGGSGEVTLVYSYAPVPVPVPAVDIPARVGLFLLLGALGTMALTLASPSARVRAVRVR